MKKKFYRRWWFWLIIVLLVIGAIGSSKDDAPGARGQPRVHRERRARIHAHPDAYAYA